MERTLVLLKPDCLQRRLAWEVIRRIENKGLNLIAIRMLWITPDLAKRHYAEHVDKPFYANLEGYITGSPSIALIVEGPEVIRILREMVGPTNGRKAPPGTIRGDFGTSGQRNLVHASDSVDAARREIDLYFSEDNICSYRPAVQDWL